MSTSPRTWHHRSQCEHMIGAVVADQKPPPKDSEVTMTLTKEMLGSTVRLWALKLTYEGNTYTVAKGGNIQLGRDKTTDVVVESSLASRHHARIFERDGHFVLADQSSNGTFLRNDGHMNEITLHGDAAMLGERGGIGFARAR